MLKFVVFNGDVLASDRVLRHAFLLGPDNVAAAGKINAEGGYITCLKNAGETAAFATQVDLDQPTLDQLTDQNDDPAPDELPLTPLGSLTLQTCLLPERERPYLLSLELARHRLMLFLNKLEEWMLTDLSPDHPAMRRFEAARAEFTRALVAQHTDGSSNNGTHGYTPQSHRWAVRALWHAVDAGERLALLAARRDMKRRATNELYERAAESSSADASPKALTPLVNPAGAGVVLPNRAAVGLTVEPTRFTDADKALVTDAADFVTVPMRWTDMEPSEGRYDYAATDRWIEWIVRTARLPIVAGPVVDFRPGMTPEWLHIWENDYETLRELVYEHTKAVVTRYRRTVSRWTIASGVETNESFPLTWEQMMDLTRIAVFVVRKLHPQARVQVELAHPWGEYYTANRSSLPPLLYADMLGQAGIQFDALGLRLVAAGKGRGLSTRDLMNLSAALDQYAVLDRPVSITALAAPRRGLDDPAAHPGWWRAPWSDGQQAAWLAAACLVASGKPFVQSVCWGALADPATGLLDADGARTPAADRLVAVRNALAAGIAPDELIPFADLASTGVA